MAEQTRIAIIGGGVTGLCAAHYLSEAYGAENVLLIEASDQLGGQTRTTHADGFSCDWGPNGFLDREPLTLQWVADLGAEKDLIRANESSAHRFILRDNKLIEVPLSPPKFLTSPLLSLRGRARVLCEPLISKRTDPSPESLWRFAARRIGREAADYMVDPMASGIFGGDSKQLVLENCFPKMAEMEAQYGSLFKAMLAKRKQKKKVSTAGPAGTLTSFESGIGHLSEVAAQRFGSRVLYGKRVMKLQRTQSGYHLETDPGPAIDAEAVVVALPSYAASAITTDFDTALSEALGTIPYANIVVLCTGYRREKVGHDLNGFGFVVPRNQKKRVLGCIWSSSIFAGRAPEGSVQLRTMYGGYTDQEIINLTDKELLSLLKDEVESLLRVDGAPEFVQIYRWPRGIPQYVQDHGARLAQIEKAEQRHPGLVFAGNAYRGVGLNDCVLSAHRAVVALSKSTALTSPK
jgi:oxygen-dependent protoporphyrinogen oxidase